MDEETTKTYLKRLMSEKAKLEQRIDTLEGKGEGGTMQSMKDSIGELSSYDNHPADVSSELFERGKDIKLCEDAKILLKRVDEAIELLNSGKYGICEHCSGSIEEERLELIPYTRLCSRCQSHMDIAQPPGKDRPVEEEVLGIPFGGGTRDRKTPGIDGEDIWQELERYGSASGPQDLAGTLDDAEVYEKGRGDVGKPVEDVDMIATKDYKVIPDAGRSRTRRKR